MDDLSDFEAYKSDTRNWICPFKSDYISFENSPDFIFPYKQFIDVYEGSLKENETWLSELSALIQTDKKCIRKILYDREPKNGRCRSMDEERLKYVRKLAAK